MNNDGNKHTIAYGDFPSQFYEDIFASNIDLVVFNSDENTPNDFILEPPKDHTQNYIQYPANTIVFCVNDIEDISEGINKLTNSIYWSPHAKHIVHTKHKADNHMIFYMMWLNKVLNCIIIDDDFYVYDFNPYVAVIDESFPNQYGCWSLKNMSSYDENMLPNIKCKKGCKDLDFDRFSNTQFYTACIEIRQRKYEENSSYFEDKTINMNGYKIALYGVSISMCLDTETVNGQLKFKGKHGYFVDTILEKMNMSFTYMTRSDILMSEWFRIFLQLEERKIDMMANPLYVKPYVKPQIDFTNYIEESGLCFVVRKPEIIPTWKTFRSIFDKNGLILTLIVFHLTVFIFLIFLRPKPRNFFEKLIYSYLCTVQLFVSQPVDWIIKKKYIRVYIFIIYWFVFVANFILQGTIAALLAIPKTEKTIDTFVDLYESGYMIEGFSELDTSFPSTSPLYIALNKRFVRIDSFYACINDLQKGIKKACWMDCAMAHIFSKTLKDKNGKAFIHILQEKFSTHYLALTLNHNSPLTKRMNFYIKRIIESGLSQKWKTFYTFDKSGSMELDKLNMTDNQLCFFLLIFGLGFASVFFVLEHILNFVTKRMRNLKNRSKNRK